MGNEKQLTTADVRFEVNDGVAIMTITRAERGNSLSAGVSAAFRAMWQEVRVSPRPNVPKMSCMSCGRYSAHYEYSPVATGAA